MSLLQISSNKEFYSIAASDEFYMKLLRNDVVIEGNYIIKYILIKEKLINENILIIS